MNLRETIRHTGIVVNNIPDALDFYGNVLGFKEIARGKLDQYEVLKFLGLIDTSLIWVKLKPQEGYSLLELYFFESEKTREWLEDQKYDNDLGIEQFPFNHISITVDDAEKLHIKLIENDLEPICSPSIDAECKHKLFFCRDPFDNLLEFVEIL